MKQHFPLKNVQQEKRIFRNRIYFSLGIVIFFLLLLVSRYSYLQIFNYDKFATDSDKNRVRLQPLPPAHHLDVGAFPGPARVSGFGGGAVFCPACRAEHSGGDGVRGARGAAAHPAALATVVA